MIKKSFILYHDICEVFDDLADEEAGKLIKEIVKTARTITHDNPQQPTGLTGLLKAVFNPFKSHLLRDSEKYQTIVERNKMNGSKGGRPKVKTQRNPKKPDNVNDKDNDKEKKGVVRAIRLEKYTDKEGDLTDRETLPAEFYDTAMKEHDWTDKQLWWVWYNFWDYFDSANAKVPAKKDWLQTWRAWCRKENPPVEFNKEEGYGKKKSRY